MAEARMGKMNTELLQIWKEYKSQVSFYANEN